jgi:hypothetical protein
MKTNNWVGEDRPISIGGGGTTTRTASNLNTVVNRDSAYASANEAKTVRTVQSIRKSMNKLEAISQMNWSKRDVPADILAPGSTVFNRVHTTVDPQVFS